MKSNEITELGFYWFFEDDRWNVVEVTSYSTGTSVYWEFARAGDEAFRPLDGEQGRFEGPLCPPDRKHLYLARK